MDLADVPGKVRDRAQLAYSLALNHNPLTKCDDHGHTLFHTLAEALLQLADTASARLCVLVPGGS